MARKALRRGELFEIDLGDGRYTAAMALKHPLVVFFDVISGGEIAPNTDMPVAFKCWVMDSAFRGTGWRSIGVFEPNPDWENIAFVKTDVISGAVRAYRDGVEVPITISDAAQMEPAAVWSGNHVIDRLRDHFDARPNKWLESLKNVMGGVSGIRK
ncbi:Imm26 family immunity protein [Rhizobium sp. CIAT894]|uniref:Imm26 family immunity protein n=1 Tax=Rhizobium sp. CIAT894 TaxID=2020312 RepID=UPI000A1DF0AD|nr:Imm26 family immunity protein [Rhizobium sp. CIAT894]